MNSLAVVIPTRRRKHYLRKCVDSLYEAAAHTPIPIDIIISSNNADTEHKHVERYAKLLNVKVLRHRRVMTACEHIQLLFEHPPTKSEYIWFLGDDDWVTPDAFVRLGESILGDWNIVNTDYDYLQSIPPAILPAKRALIHLYTHSPDLVLAPGCLPLNIFKTSKLATVPPRYLTQYPLAECYAEACPQTTILPELKIITQPAMRPLPVDKDLPDAEEGWRDLLNRVYNRLFETSFQVNAISAAVHNRIEIEVQTDPLLALYKYARFLLNPEAWRCYLLRSKLPKNKRPENSCTRVAKQSWFNP